MGTDVVANISNLMYEVVKWLQIVAVPSAAVAFCIGGVIQIFGGAEGVRKAKPWYFGGAIGLVIVLGATALASFLKSNVGF